MSVVALQYNVIDNAEAQTEDPCFQEPCTQTPNLPGLFEDEGQMLPLLDMLTPAPEVERSLQRSQQAAVSLWSQIVPELQNFYGEQIWRAWLRHIQPAGLSDQDMILAAPSPLMRDWIERNYLDRISHYVRRADHEVNTVRMVIDASVTPFQMEAGSVQVELANANDNPAASHSIEEPNHALFSSRLDPRYTFDQFIVDKSNMLAFNAAQRVAASDQPQFNPLFLQGGVGLGKTHLMHAIAAEIRRRTPQRKVLYVSAEQFMYQFVRALRDRSALEFKELFRSVDVLMIDDVQFICGKDSTQEEFFHTFNALIEQNKQIILSADKSPCDLQGVGARLTSRMGSGLVAEIHGTTYELRLGILQSRLISQKAAAPREVLEFLAQNISSNVRELVGALNRVLAHAELTGREVTLDYAQDILADLLRGAARRVTIEDIQRRVADHYGIRLADMHSPRRARAVARPRQLAMYLSKILTDRSLPEIGRKFGGRDHTTVMHAVRTIETLLPSDPALAEDVRLLQRAVSE